MCTTLYLGSSHASFIHWIDDISTGSIPAPAHRQNKALKIREDFIWISWHGCSYSNVRSVESRSSWQPTGKPWSDQMHACTHARTHARWRHRHLPVWIRYPPYYEHALPSLEIWNRLSQFKQNCFLGENNRYTTIAWVNREDVCSKKRGKGAHLYEYDLVFG